MSNTPDPLDPFVECGEEAKTRITDAILAAYDGDNQAAAVAAADALKLVQAMVAVWTPLAPNAEPRRFELRTIKVEYCD